MSIEVPGFLVVLGTVIVGLALISFRALMFLTEGTQHNGN